MIDSLYTLLMKLPRANLINLFWEALDEMQSYNGHSKLHCIMSALGAEEIEEGKWKRPSFSEAKKNTKGHSFLFDC